MPRALKWGENEDRWREPEREDRPSVLVDTSKLKTEVFRLGNLPPEIRVIICQFTGLDWKMRREALTIREWVPREMPPLIVTLRCWEKREMYFEALKLFYQQNSYVFQCNSPWLYEGPASRAWHTIQKAVLIT
jgi:hypothetical protein